MSFRRETPICSGGLKQPVFATTSICRAALDFIKLQHILQFGITEKTPQLNYYDAADRRMLFVIKKEKPLKNTHILAPPEMKSKYLSNLIGKICM